jgi:hypothetical protein
MPSSKLITRHILSETHFFSALNRIIYNTLRSIGPSSSLHAADTNPLQPREAKIRDAICLMEQHMSQFLNARPDISIHFELAYKGIVREATKKPILQPLKPELNTSDII